MPMLNSYAYATYETSILMRGQEKRARITRHSQQELAKYLVEYNVKVFENTGAKLE